MIFLVVDGSTAVEQQTGNVCIAGKGGGMECGEAPAGARANVGAMVNQICCGGVPGRLVTR